MIDFFQTIGGAVMTPLYYVISAILIGWHNVWGSIFRPERASPGCCRSSA